MACNSLFTIWNKTGLDKIIYSHIFYNSSYVLDEWKRVAGLIRRHVKRYLFFIVLKDIFANFFLLILAWGGHHWSSTSNTNATELQLGLKAHQILHLNF